MKRLDHKLTTWTWAILYALPIVLVIVSSLHNDTITATNVWQFLGATNIADYFGSLQSKLAEVNLNIPDFVFNFCSWWLVCFLARVFCDFALLLPRIAVRLGEKFSDEV